ncbi:MAG: ComEC family competence protein, partial [Clostridiales Family XIII bacterium]|nr:ComEC family competence protein [Clostridiales Family XIII bacterium]
MPVRRPLCLISFAYVLGIGCAYVFSVDSRTFCIGGLVCAAAVFFISGKVCAGFAPVSGGVGASSAPVAGVVVTPRSFAFVLLFVFIAGGLYCARELEREDALEQYAISRYNNPEYGVRGKGDDHASDEAEDSADVGENTASADEVSAPPGSMPAQRGRVLKVRVRDEDYISLTVASEGRNVLVNVRGEGLSPKDIIGREIAFSGAVELPTGRRNPGTFDYALYLKTQDVRVIVNCDVSDLAFAPSDMSPIWDAYASLCRLKYSFLERALTAMPEEEYGLFAGMMFGGSSEMDEESYDLFRRNGVAHILSVSGLHVAIVYAFLNMLLGRRKTLAVYAAVAAALICYAAMSEFSPSVVRAVTMIGLHIASKVLSLRYDLLTGTMAAAFIMLLVNPLDLMSVGFRLSFIAVLLLAFGTPLASRY